MQAVSVLQKETNKRQLLGQRLDPKGSEFQKGRGRRQTARKLKDTTKTVKGGRSHIKTMANSHWAGKESSKIGNARHKVTNDYQISSSTQGNNYRKPGMSDSATNISQHLSLFNKARIRLAHVMKSANVDQPSNKLITALTTYAKEVRAITQPVEVEGSLTGENLHVEKKRKKVVSNTLLGMATKLKNGKAQFEVISLDWWAKSNGDSTSYLLHRAALTCYSRELLIVASKIGFMKSVAKRIPGGLAAMIQIQLASATKKGIVDALEVLDEDSVFREKFENNRLRSYHYSQMERYFFNESPENPMTLKKIIELVQREL